jgi:hypothetical protein
LRGDRVLTGIWLGCFFTYYLESHQFALSCNFASVFAMQAFLLTWITRRYIHPSLVFYHAKQLLMFSLLSGMLTAITSMILIWLSGQSYTQWLQWWLANFNGVIIVSIAWIATDTFCTFNGKLMGSHVAWYRTSQWAFIITLIFNTAIYMNLSLAPLTGLSIIQLQCLLCLGTLGSLFASLINYPYK